MVPHIDEVSRVNYQNLLVCKIQNFGILHVQIFVDFVLIHVAIQLFLQLQVFQQSEILFTRDRQGKEINECGILYIRVLPAVHFQRKQRFQRTQVVIGLNVKDMIESRQTGTQQFVVGMVFGYYVLKLRIALHIIVANSLSYQLMKNFQDPDYQLWKTKWELAKEGDPTLCSELKQHLTIQSQTEHLLLTCNFKTLLQQSKLYQIEKDETYGSYELYSKVPTFLLLSGHAMIQCINMEGDNQILVKVEKGGVLQITESMLKIKYGQNNITLITQFEIVGLEKSVLIELNPKSTLSALKYLDENKISLKEEIIMRKYMLIALKHITKLTYSKGTSLTQKFYLLEGRICYYNTKTKTILCCYQEGYFNPQQFQNTDIKMYVFEGSLLMILESEMLKDEVATGVESKRDEHINNILKNYQKMGSEEISKLQQKLISKYKLSKKEVQKQILGIEKVVEKLSKTKTDLTTTNTSMKDSMRDKCGIRIRKTKKN